MKKLFFIILFTLSTNLLADEKQTEARIAKFVMENIQKDYVNCYSFYKVAAESLKKTDKQIINSLKSVWNEYYKIEYLPTLDLRKREFETLVHSECTSKNKQEKTKRNKTMNETQEINNGFFVESESENYNTNENLTPLEQVEYGKAGLKFQMEYVKWHSNRIKELDVLQITDTTPAIDLNSPMVRKDLLKYLLVRLPYSERLTKRLFQDKIGIRYESKSKTNWFKY